MPKIIVIGRLLLKLSYKM